MEKVQFVTRKQQGDNMNAIIEVVSDKIGGLEIKTVNARDLHAYLESKQEFSAWIKNRIKKYNFIQGVDFITIDNPITSPPSIDYHVTLDMAKELSMVERTERGKQARQYFIECEKIALSAPIDPIKVLNDPAAMRGLLLTYSEKVLALEDTIQAQAPTIAAFDRIALADGLLNITNTAKTLQIHPNQLLFSYMNQNGWIYRKSGGKSWVAYQGRIQQGLLSHKVTTVQTSDGRDKVIEQVLVTPKGLAKLASIFSAEATA